MRRRGGEEASGLDCMQSQAIDSLCRCGSGSAWKRAVAVPARCRAGGDIAQRVSEEKSRTSDAIKEKGWC